ncbi:MAG: hypothetical protein VB091_03410 [Christensenella sp.]|nr:hypothetical protein [Christensenella sp.]
MYFLLALLPVLLLALAAARLFRRTLGQTLPVALFFVVLVVYLGGLCGSLTTGRIVIVLIGIASLLYLFVSLVRNIGFRQSPFSFFSPDLTLVLISSVLIVLLTIGRKVTDMDSFEQWGYIVKKMYYTGSLLSARGQYASTLSYPPGMGLLQYYFASFSPSFNEADLFRARDLFALSLLLPFFHNLDWNRWKTLLLVIPIALLLPFLEYSGFASELVVDPMLGLLFAWLILAAAEETPVHWFTLVGLGLGSFLLAFTKVSGVFFVILAAAILFFQRVRRPLPKHLPYPRPRWALPALVVLLSGIVGWLAWQLTVSANAAGGSLSAVLTLKNGFLPYQKETIVNFLDALFVAEGGEGFGMLSPALWIAAVPFLSAIAVRIFNANPYEGKESRLNALLLTAGYLVWLLVLLMGYLTSFVEGEALSLAAFSRYLSSYQLGALVVCLYPVVHAMTLREPHARRNLLALLLIALLLMAPLRSVFDATIGAPYANSKTTDWRARYAPADRLYERLDPAYTKICFLDENPTEPGYSFALFQFEALPYDVEKAVAWRLGGPYYDADYYSLSPSAEEWGRALLDGGFTHLYLRTTSDSFAATYGSLFANAADIQSDSYYAISEANGQALLTRVNPA